MVLWECGNEEQSNDWFQGLCFSGGFLSSVLSLVGACLLRLCGRLWSLCVVAWTMVRNNRVSVNRVCFNCPLLDGFFFYSFYSCFTDEEQMKWMRWWKWKNDGETHEDKLFWGARSEGDEWVFAMDWFFKFSLRLNASQLGGNSGGCETLICIGLFVLNVINDEIFQNQFLWKIIWNNFDLEVFLVYRPALFGTVLSS